MTLVLILIFFSLSFSQEKLFHIMGTYAVVEFADEKHAYKAFRIMKSIEEKLSDYIDTSEVSMINQKAGYGCLNASEETVEVIRYALRASEKTYGFFDITVGSYTVNFKRKGILKEEEAKRLIDYRKVKIEGNRVCLLEKGMAIDLGGLGKGYAVQKVYERLKTDSGFVSIAGDLKVWGHRRLLSVFNPINNSTLMEGYNAKDLCLSTGGNYFRKHIIGKDNNLLQATVAYENCTLADAYQTAILAMDSQTLEKFIKENQDVGLLLLFKDGTVYINRAYMNYFESLKLYPY